MHETMMSEKAHVNCCEPGKESDVVRELKTLEAAIEENYVLESRIEDRVAKVLSDVDPSDKSEEPSVGSMVPLAEEIYDLARRVQITNRNMESMLRRIEL